MQDFKQYMTEDASDGLLHFLNRRYVLDLLREAQIITQNDNKPIVPGEGGESLNPLVPYGNFKTTDKNGHMSGFLRDQPPLRNYAMANPDNLASVIIFVLLTIRADFQQAVEDFRVIIPWLKGHYGKDHSGMDDAGDAVAGGIDDLQTKLARISNPKMHDKDGFTAGYGLKSTAFGFKNPAITKVWKERHKIFDTVSAFASKEDVVGMHQYITKEIGGLGPVKAGFVVQLMMGKLGCIDMHNINLYSQYAKHYKKDDLYNALDPKKYSGKTPDQIANYLKVLEMLEKEGANTIKLWDIWTNYVAVNYTSSSTGKSRYDDKGMFSGHSVDDKDELYQKLQGIGDVPDRSGGKDTLFKASGRSRGSLAASLGHATIYQIHDKKFWDDLLRAAENPLATPDAIRVQKPAATDRPSKALAYVVADPKLAASIGLDQDFLDRAREVLQRRGVLTGKNYLDQGGQRVMWSPTPLGARHNPVRAKAEKKPALVTKAAPDTPSLF